MANYFRLGFAAAAAATALWVQYETGGFSANGVDWSKAENTSVWPEGDRDNPQRDISALPQEAGSGNRPLWQVIYGGVMPERDYVSQFQDKFIDQKRVKRAASAICVRRATTLDCG